MTGSGASMLLTSGLQVDMVSARIVSTSGINLYGDIVMTSGLMLVRSPDMSEIDPITHVHTGTAQMGQQLSHLDALTDVNNASTHPLFFSQSGEVRNLLSSGGATFATVSGCLAIFSGVVAYGNISAASITATALKAGAVESTGVISGLSVTTSGLTVNGAMVLTGGVSTPANISALFITVSGLVTGGPISGASITTSGLTVGGVSVLTGGVTSPTTISGRLISASGVVTGGPISGASLTVNGLSIFTGGVTSPTSISALSITTSGLTVGGVSVLTGGLSTPGVISGLTIMTSGLIVGGVISGLIMNGLTADLISGKSLVLTSGLVSDGATASLMSGKQLFLTSGLVSQNISGVFIATPSLVAQNISSSMLNATSGLVTFSISAAVISATSGYIGMATSGRYLTSFGSGQIMGYTTPPSSTSPRVLLRASETESSVTGTTSGESVKTTRIAYAGTPGISTIYVNAEIRTSDATSGVLMIQEDTSSTPRLTLVTNTSNYTSGFLAGSFAVSWLSGSVHYFDASLVVGVSGAVGYNRLLEYYAE